MIIKNNNYFNKIIYKNKEVLKIYFQDHLVYLSQNADPNRIFNDLFLDKFENFYENGKTSTRISLIDEPLYLKSIENITTPSNIHSDWGNINVTLFEYDKLKVTLKNNQEEFIYGAMTGIHFYNITENEISYNEGALYISTDYSYENKNLKELKYNIKSIVEKIKNSIDKITLENIDLAFQKQHFTNKKTALEVLHSIPSQGLYSTDDTITANYKIYFKNLTNLKIYGLENNIVDYKIENMSYNIVQDEVVQIDQAVLSFCVEILVDNKKYYLKFTFNTNNIQESNVNIDKEFFKEMKYMLEVKLVENPENIMLNFNSVPKFLDSL